MVTRFYIQILLFVFVQSSFAQKAPTFQDSVARYFTELRDATKKNQTLWNKNLYGPILLINPDTRQLYSNYPDSAGVLKQNGKIYIGTLPVEINFANTAINWTGRRWALIMLPLPENKESRIDLLAHESFHRVQPSLGFTLFNTINNHLDKKDGRIYLRLELEALYKALQATNNNELKEHLTNAFTFRMYRYSLYRGADSTENLLELNEGLAEYTGSVISGRNTEQSIAHFQKSIKSFFYSSTFVRSFAYETTPVYGYLLRKSKNNWTRSITPKSNLTNYFIEAFKISLPHQLQDRVQAISSKYNGPTIFAEEAVREENVKKLITEYKNKFIEQPHFDITFEKDDISFDPRKIMPVENKGTYYENIRVTDNWGILIVQKGVLLSSDGRNASLTIPEKIFEKKVSGDGWLLELNDGYSVIKDENTDNYNLIKK